MQQNAVHVHSLGMIRIASQRPAQPLPRATRIALGGTELAPGQQRLHLLGIQGKGRAQVRLGLGVAVLLALQNRQIDPARGQIGTQLDGPPQCGLGIDLAPLLAQQAAKIDPGGGKVRTQHQRTAITALGLFRPSHARQHEPHCKLALGKFWLQRQSPLIAIESLFVAPQHRQRMTQAHQRRDKRGLTAKRDLEFPDSFLGTAHGQHQLAEAHARQSIAAVQPDRVRVDELCLFVTASGLEGLAERDPSRKHLWRGGDGGLGHPDRGFRLAASQRDQADAHQRIRMTGIADQHALKAESHLGKMSFQLGRKLGLVCLHREPDLRVVQPWTLGWLQRRLNRNVRELGRLWISISRYLSWFRFGTERLQNCCEDDEPNPKISKRLWNRSSYKKINCKVLKI